MRAEALDRQHASPYDPVVWLGDMNIAVEPIDVTQPQSKNDPCYHEEARKAFLEVYDFGFTDLPQVPSR